MKRVGDTAFNVELAQSANKATIDKPAIQLRVASWVWWLYLTISSIAIFPFAAVVWMVTAPFDRKLKILHRFTCAWASLYTWTSPWWPTRIIGREKIQKNVPYVMVANHQSLLDIIVLFRLFVHYKWVSKIENFRVPCIGWNMILNRYIPLRRGDKRSIAEMMRGCEKTIGEGNPVMMFPEGTRSRDGRLRPFKHGAFTIAKRAGVPILPIVIEGTGNALPKAGFVLQGRHHITVRVLDPIAPEDFPEGKVDHLAEHVREIFKAELGED